MKSLEERVNAIEARNAKVELDKAWETSWLRKGSIIVLTYLVVVVYLIIIRNDQPFINALVPPLGFTLSTLVLKTIQKLWEDKK